MFTVNLFTKLIYCAYIDQMHSYFTFEIKALSLQLDILAGKYLKATYNISYSEFLVLLSLASCKSLTQRQIAHWTQLSEMVISNLVKSLVAQQKLLKRVNPTNKRENVITISDQAAAQALSALAELDALFLSQLSQQAQQQARQIHPTISEIHHDFRGAPPQ